jgi:hypothetical protein
VLVAVLLGVMLGLPPIATVWLITVLVLIGADWAAFITTARRAALPSRSLFAARVLLFYSCSPPFVPMVMTAAMVWWIVAWLWKSHAPARVNPLSAGFAGLWRWCLLAGAGVCHAEYRRAQWVLFTLALVWSAGTGAFLPGALVRAPAAGAVFPQGREGVRRGVDSPHGAGSPD